MDYTKSRKNTSSEQVNDSEAARLFRHVLGDGEGYMAIFSGVRAPGAPTDPLKYRDQRFFKCPTELGVAAAHAIDRSCESMREVYFSAHALTDKRRKKEHAAPLWCLYAELDGARLNEVVKKYATAVVESSPNHYQVFVRLTRPLPPEEAERLNKRLALAVDGDPSGWDLSQVLRVPGTPNNKYGDKPTVKIRKLLSDVAHDPEVLNGDLDPLPEDRTTPIRERTSENVVEEDEELLTKARKARDGKLFKKLFDEGDATDFEGDRSAAVYKLCQQLAFWTGWDEERIENLLHASAWKDYHKLRRPDWVALTIKKAIATTPRAYGQAAQVDSHLSEALEALRTEAARDPWVGRGGPVDCHVYGALVNQAEKYGTLKGERVFIAADERTLALGAGTGRRTVGRSIDRLKERRKIQVVRRGSGQRATVYALKVPANVPDSRGGHNQHTFCGPPLSTLRNPAPMPQKEFDKNGRKLHAPDYLVQRVGKSAALILERVGAAGADGITVLELAASLGRRTSNLRRTLERLLETNLLGLTGEDERLRLSVNFDFLLEQELVESGCVEAAERDRARYERHRKERFKRRPVDSAPTEEDLDREHAARVDHVVALFLEPRSGPGIAFRLHRNGEAKEFEFVVNAVAYYCGVDPPAWWSVVADAYELAVNGEVAS